MYLPQTEFEEDSRQEAADLPRKRPAHPPAKAASSLRQVLRWGVLVGVGAFLVWRILVLGIADYYASSNPEQALAWDKYNPQALRKQGAHLLLTEQDPKQTEYLLQEAIRQNPSDARAYALLALLREKAGEGEAAQRLMERASALGPRLWPVQLEAAAFWLRQHQLKRAVQSWDVALQMHRRLSTELFPVLLKIAERPGFHQVLFPIAGNSPAWWPSFFAYAAANAVQLETVRALYEAKEGIAPSDQERRAFLSRLQKEGQWIEAYYAWLDALDESALQALGNVFNGDFERPLSNEGFGWHFSQPRGIEIDAVPTYGAEGDQALRVVFSGQRVRFRHLYQPLLLSPGTYQLIGNARLDNLETALGLQWAVYCLAPAQQQLATSERFLGASFWHRFDFSFEVPEEACTVQLLRLELLGRAPADFEARGVAWFDSLAIERVKESSPLARQSEEQ
jgi:hypothetical protein